MKPKGCPIAVKSPQHRRRRARTWNEKRELLLTIVITAESPKNALKNSFLAHLKSWITWVKKVLIIPFNRWYFRRFVSIYFFRI
jgi:hypothetical protein